MKILAGSPIHEEEDIFDASDSCFATKPNVHVERVAKVGGAGYWCGISAAFVNRSDFAELEGGIAVYVDKVYCRFGDLWEEAGDVVNATKSNTPTEFVRCDADDLRKC